MLSIGEVHIIRVLFLCNIALVLCAILRYTKDNGEGGIYREAPLSTKKRGLFMPIKYKFDILARLKEAGYSSTRIRKEKLMGQATMTQLRRGELVSWMNIETICRLLQCQPGDILEYVEDSPE